MGALISIPPLFVDQPCRRRILQSNPQEDLVSNPVKCDFTLSSLLEDTAGHSLSLPYIRRLPVNFYRNCQVICWFYPFIWVSNFFYQFICTFNWFSVWSV